MIVGIMIRGGAVERGLVLGWEGEEMKEENKEEEEKEGRGKGNGMGVIGAEEGKSLVLGGNRGKDGIPPFRFQLFILRVIGMCIHSYKKY